MLRTITMLLHQVFEDYHIYYRAHPSWAAQ
jgi:hypothetical protein